MWTQKPYAAEWTKGEFPSELRVIRCQDYGRTYIASRRNPTNPNAFEMVTSASGRWTKFRSPEAAMRAAEKKWS